MTDNTKIPENSEPSVDQRRSVLKKLAGGGAFAALSLAHRPVMAAGGKCTPSGHVSSATHASMATKGDFPQFEKCGEGFSPGGWKCPYQNGSGGSHDGNPNHWKQARCVPHDPDDYVQSYKKRKSASHSWERDFSRQQPTKFKSVFGSEPRGMSRDCSLDQAMYKYPGSLECHAAATFLNSKKFGWNGSNGVHPVDVVNLYWGAKKNRSVTLQNGTSVRFTASELKFFFESLYA